MRNKVNCSICGGTAFKEQRVLWEELVAEWQLSERERDYIDRQQGCACISCGANLRIVALGEAIRAMIGTLLPLRNAVASGLISHLRILDCNGAVGISDVLSVLPNYRRADYPNYDMRQLPFRSGSFDLIIHSDTLEHIEHPVVALQECRRLLAPTGRLCFTVPIVFGRLTRNRAGLPPSYHGDPAVDRNAFLVHSEFGADAWTLIHEAGFSNLMLNEVDFPSAIAISAWNEVPIESAVNSIVEPSKVAAVAEVRSVYDQDGMRSVHNHEFTHDPIFQSAYARGVRAAGEDYRWHWRVHTGLWAARMAAKLQGDFCEFGVNRGFLSSAIMQMLDWNTAGRRFYLLDTFTGVDERYISEEDRNIGVVERNQGDIERGFYTFDLDGVRANFSEWSNVCIIPGPVPETLAQINSDEIAFAHIDMNCSPPEVAAAEFIWPRLVPGAIILLDDYAYNGYRSQKLAIDKFAASKQVPVLSLPTGQGLIIKPPI